MCQNEITFLSCLSQFQRFSFFFFKSYSPSPSLVSNLIYSNLFSFSTLNWQSSHFGGVHLTQKLHSCDVPELTIVRFILSSFKLFHFKWHQIGENQRSAIPHSAAYHFHKKKSHWDNSSSAKCQKKICYCRPFEYMFVCCVYTPAKINQNFRLLIVYLDE